MDSTVFDIISVSYSAYRYFKNPTNKNAITLEIDVACLLIPGVSALGIVAISKLKITSKIKSMKRMSNIFNTGTKISKRALNSAKNQKLKNTIKELYRSGAKIGDGGLADAIKYELLTGELVGGKSHIKKGYERIKNLENIIKKENLCSSDLKLAKQLLNNLKDALGVK